MSERLNADFHHYRQAAALNTAPPQIVSDPLVTGVTPIEQLLRALGLAANLGDTRDNVTAAEQHAERDAKTLEAAEKFAAQDDQSAAELTSIDAGPYAAGDGAASQPDRAAGMAQQLPQMAAGIAGALAGAIGGALQPFAQIPQQAAQGLQQAMQSGMGLFQQAADVSSTPPDDVAPAEDPSAEGLGDFTDDLGGLDGGAGFGGGDSGAGLGAGRGDPGGGTSPTAYLGPPPVPSAGTAPASVPMTTVTPAPTAPAGPSGTPGMAGMPMVPPGAMTGAPGTDKDPKADTKRVSVPPVRNGAPVQGRLTVPPALPPVVKKAQDQPVVTRRLAAQLDRRPGDDS